MKYLIIGGVAGGATTAARLRRLDEDSQIILFERGAYISYANCGLPYYIGGTIAERDDLFVQTPESFYDRFHIEVRINSEVLSIDRKEKSIEVRDLTGGRTYSESYDKLVLSPGAEPVKPPIPGIESEGIFTLRSVPDTDRIHEYIAEKKPERAVIVGAGFIGLEMAENLHRRGIFVTIVEMANQVMNILDYEMAAEVHQHLKLKNVEFYLEDAVSAFKPDRNKKLSVHLRSGKVLPADMVILSIGVKPDTTLAQKAGLEIGESGGIKVDSHLLTSDRDIYALGDAIEFPNPISGHPMKIPLAGPANKQGRIVADNIVRGNSRTYKGTIGTGIAKVFDITVASTGLPEKLLKGIGIPHTSVITHSGSHAGYYPGAIPMTIKILFNPEDGRLLGGQVVGYEGVDKRIDLIASIIGMGGNVSDLAEIEHAYAPPFSSAKDPVNISGMVAENVIKGTSLQASWTEVFNPEKKKDILLLDVRTEEEHALGSVESALNIPVDDLRRRIGELPRDRKIVLFCSVGLRAYVAERILRQHGFSNVANLSGGYKTYSISTQKQSNEDIFSGEFIGKDDHIYQGVPRKSEGIQVKRIDASGMQCPGPIMRLKKEIESLDSGDRLVQTATDPGFARDVESWCRMTGNSLLSVSHEGGVITAEIEKGRPLAPNPMRQGNGTTLVVFSDDLDRALASFVIANGAAASGREVTLFFTFWGLNVIKAQHKPKVKKDLMGRMFSLMMPASSRKLSLSKINMGGMGSRMMRRRMKSRGVDSLETMIDQAREAGVRLVACQMSMDIMGVQKEELIDGVEVGGVATFLESAQESSASLFV
ncbi:pyridine nucleotide-disulfide oxidoreductase [Marispirochaeta aestuarii]|uniref:Pyridine nucleotide-disulfide oxidoreductase n=1 Tax=Marispirochaeta aestuarii TaxID=1963862 RepID=A0A1Y1RVI8_9SPIO|nr:FAD-dependent oxidoreductase [Marispirochaeta aestuarii]ORC32677.1 pyridine nucleotide-disulfide oxidoreductase [Marispirochaeta aestuarii]